MHSMQDHSDDEYSAVAKTCLTNLGLCYHQTGDFDQAMDSFTTSASFLSARAIDLAEKATIATHMACTFLMQQKYDDAVSAGKRSYFFSFLLMIKCLIQKTLLLQTRNNSNYGLQYLSPCMRHFIGT
jgi:Tfp pilus assembly protein PilF